MGMAGRAGERAQRAVKMAYLHLQYTSIHPGSLLPSGGKFGKHSTHTANFVPAAVLTTTNGGSLQTEFQPSRTIIKRVREENTRFNVNSPKIHRIFF